MIIINGFILFSAAASLANSEVILKQTDEKLHWLNESLELAEQQAGLGNWEFDVKSQNRNWSKQMFRLFNLVPSDKAPSNEEVLELIKAVFQMDEDSDMEKNIFRTNSPKIPLKYLLPRWDVIKDSNGNPIKYYGTLQDITERIAAREALKQREELFSKAFHSKVFGLAIVNKERRVVDINETLANLIEYKREDFIGKTSVEIGLTQPGYIRKRDELLVLLLQKGRINNYEFEMKTRYGKPLSLLLSVEPMNLNDKSHWLIYLVDITEKKKTEEEIKKAVEQIKTYNEQLHQLTAHLQNIREEERSRIGREIHDQLGQHLTVLKLEVSRLQMKKSLEKNSENDIVEILNQFDNCISIARKISYDLRPGILDDLGIIDAIEWQMAEFEKRTKIKTKFLVNVTELILSPSYAVGLFRIFQESLTNIARHSKAKRVIGTLNVKNNFIELKITDDGRGFDIAAIDNKNNLGILGMKERTLLMKGSYEIESTPGIGTEVKVTIPLP
jgi:PAS domain S-box-containing protein